MASPLLDYANTRLRVVSETGITIVNGRPTRTTGNIYLIQCFLKRVQYSGVSSGSRKVPLPVELGGLMMPGASGDQFYYRGYALRKAEVSSTFAWETSSLASLSFIDITQQEDFLLPGTEVNLKFGNDPTIHGIIERSSGIYGGLGVDEVLYEALGGVEIQIKGGELEN